VNDLGGQFTMLHNEEPRDVYGATSVAGMVTCVRLRWGGHVTSIREENYTQKFWQGNYWKSATWET
jgi:hypothetical protein